MPDASVIKKFFLPAVSVLLIAGAVSAVPSAGLKPVDDNVLWVNGDTQESQLSYSCTDSIPVNLTFQGLDSVYTGFSKPKGEITRSELNNTFGLDDALGDRTAVLTCYNSTANNSIATDTASLNVKEFEVSYGDDAKGFFGSKLRPGEFSTPVRIERLRVRPENVGFNDISTDVEFSAPGPDVKIGEEGWDLATKKVFPTVGTDFSPSQQSFRLKATYEGGEEEVSVTRNVPVDIYSYRPEILKDPMGRKIGYEDLEDFQYTFNLKKGSGVTSEVYEGDFRLDIVNVDGGTFKQDLKIFKAVEPEGDGEYRLTLKRIPELNVGERYRFRTYIKNEAGKTPIDTVRVVRELQFSGIIRDSTGAPVRTEIYLKRNDGENIPVKTGGDGTYSTTISDRDFDTVNLKFFDRGRNYPDSRFRIQKATLGENPDLGFSSEAIRYQYWEKPVVDIKGLNTVNMMAAKFSHDISGSTSAFMKFNPQTVNPEDLKVYECSSWNFQGRKCMSSWRPMDQGDVSVNYATWEVYLQNLNLHEIPEEVTGNSNKSILMNAYAVGTTSELRLAGETPVTVSKQKLAANSEIEISGKVVDGKGQSVENADIEVELRKDGESFRTFNASSGPKGGFTASGLTPSKSGRYKVEITVRKDDYRTYTTESSKSVQVFYEKGMQISSTGSPSLGLGKDSEISFKVSNTGQKEIENLEASISGIKKKYYSKSSVPEVISADGGEGTLLIDVSLPEDYCPAPCPNPPVIDVEVSGESGSEEVKASTTLYTKINHQDQQTKDSQSESRETGETEQRKKVNSTNSTGLGIPSMGSVTGDFLKRQSSVNIALGLIMIFTLILAVAVRRKKDNGDDRRGGRGRGRPVSGQGGRVEKPQVSPQSQESEPETTAAVQKDQEEEKQSSESEEDSEGLERFYDEEKDEYVCGECGEGFDTGEGLEMHREINGLD
ncbi:MAG: hypothetical protein ABEJ93_01960 [Candidatus Nanohalobium sp.]